MVKAWTAPVDAFKVTRHRLDQSTCAIPLPRTGEQTDDPGKTAVREWHKYGRRRLYVETADGRTVGWLNLNSGAVKLTSEKERQQCEAAIIRWLAEALQVPPPALDADVTTPAAAVPKARSGSHRRA